MSTLLANFFALIALLSLVSKLKACGKNRLTAEDECEAADVPVAVSSEEAFIAAARQRKARGGMLRESTPLRKALITRI